MSIVGWMMCLEMTRFVITIQQVYITRFAWKRNIRVYLFQVRKELLCESERSYSWPLDKKQWLWLNHSLSDSRDLFFSSFSLFMCLFISSSLQLPLRTVHHHSIMSALIARQTRLPRWMRVSLSSETMFNFGRKPTFEWEPGRRTMEFVNNMVEDVLVSASFVGLFILFWNWDST
jgi:hypothetical protein